MKILAVDTAAGFLPDELLNCIQCMGFTSYVLYGVLVLEGFDPELFSHVWDFGKSQFDGADRIRRQDSHGDRR